MRAARLIRMVLLLQSRPSMTGAELARELEVSERTVSRDALALSEAGVPVYADRGRIGGYRLVGGYRTRLTGLGRSEAEALFLSGLPGALRDMGLEDAASAARLKVTAALLPSLSDAPHTAAQRFHLDAPGWYSEPETPPLLAELADAVWRDRRVTVAYANRHGERVERVLEPHGLVLKAGVWYLCARVAGGGEDASSRTDSAPSASSAPFRVYRIDRFSAVGPTAPESVPGASPEAFGSDGDGGVFDRDPDFDLPAFWEERAAQFARSILRSEVVLRLTEEGARRLPYVTDRAAAREALAAVVPDGEGRVTVTLPVESTEVAYVQLLSLGPDAEVLGPPGLRTLFAGAAARMAEQYGARLSGSRPDRASPPPAPPG
ncbi:MULTISPECIES: helix-turn-helix transcriptional regulator [Streptomyces]|uniref:Transcriptional regulator n=1 Tax=Streptomyces tsukubensis (strain DSM 42081 / NBRC 108919 / NRRL 18488 / 9993) TaxID=1114943 RepID=I2MX52_STRT9|nr:MULTISPECIES: WYL domain-containing protein [Streptomyces]AZK93744.1 transcriptional regulator [Streptomyces tsukubensis]EIF89349.1 DeoR family transcriptional regulator [Streptomyces tsukubensis NRRL18488]MYS68516.1 WYL domain-containing protein [Streptomyces sp. SID5473]QKM70116.1 transcriptional regulator [Streptomyces tsukubensis NRRL18488]TAI45906.1 WYL domain-containing protein [Streptomyces tsukubensis]